MSKTKERKRFFWIILFAAAFLLHFFVVQNKFLSFEEVFDERMIMNFDYGLHYYDAVKGVDFISHNHSFHGYDEAFFGGYEKGVSDDLSAKLWILFTWIFSFLGVMTAYKLFIYLALLAMPVLFAWVLKTWGAKKETILAGFLLAVLYQNTLKMGNFLWVGMITFPLAVYLSLLGVAFLKKFLENKGADLATWTALTIVAAISFCAHVLAAILIVVPALFLYLLSLKTVGKKKHMLLLATAGTVFAANLTWLWPLLSKGTGNLGEAATKFFQTPSWHDTWKEIFYVWVPQSFHSLNLRIILLMGAFAALIFLFKKDRKCFYFYAGVIAVFAIITYFPLAQLAYIQPYRFQIVLDLWCLLAILLTANSLLSARKLRLKMFTLSSLVAVIIASSFFFSPFKNLLVNERILSTEIDPDLAATVSYFENLKSVEPKGRVLFEVEHSADAIFFQLGTGQKMIGGPYRYAFWGNTEANFTEDAIFNTDINAIDEQKWREMINKYDIRYAVCYSQKSCSALLESKIWQELKDYGSRKIFTIK